VDARGLQRVGLSVSDQAEFGPLRKWLSSTPGPTVSQLPGTPEAGEQGVPDALELLGSSGVLIAAVRVLPEFLRSRRTRLSITMTIKGKPFRLEATNVDEVMPIIERLLDD
jgi:hypothetical protein